MMNGWWRMGGLWMVNYGWRVGGWRDGWVVDGQMDELWTDEG